MVSQVPINEFTRKADITWKDDPMGTGKSDKTPNTTNPGRTCVDDILRSAEAEILLEAAAERDFTVSQTSYIAVA